MIPGATGCSAPLPPRGRRQRGLGGTRPVVLRQWFHRGFDAALVVGIVVAVGGRQGRGREGSRSPGRGEEDEYQDRKVQGRLDETQRGREERRAVAVASGPETESQGRGASLGVAGDSDGRGLDGCAADAPPSRFGEGGLSSRPLSIVTYP